MKMLIIKLKGEGIYILNVCCRSFQNLIWKDKKYEEKRRKRGKKKKHLKKEHTFIFCNLSLGAQVGKE